MDDQAERSMKSLGNLVEKVTPWLLDVGSWIFGGLMAVNLVVIASLITVGPVDSAIQVSMTALVCALPLNVAGIVLLRLTKDVSDIRLDDLTLRVFQEAGFPEIETYFPPPQQRAALQKRRSEIVLLFSLGIAALSVALTMTGLAAALWHMAWWMGVVLFSMSVVSGLLVLLAMVMALPPESATQGERTAATMPRKSPDDADLTDAAA
jgi:hypothetical protein